MIHQHDRTGGCCGPVTSVAPLAVTINPEARVSAVRTSTLIAAPTANEWFTLPIEVRNEGYVTGLLSLSTAPSPDLEVLTPPCLLTGEQSQFAALQLRMREQVVDVTLTFRAESALGGLANHSTVDFLLRAQGPHSHPVHVGLPLIES